MFVSYLVGKGMVKFSHNEAQIQLILLNFTLIFFAYTFTCSNTENNINISTKCNKIRHILINLFIIHKTKNKFHA